MADARLVCLRDRRVCREGAVGRGAERPAGPPDRVEWRVPDHPGRDPRNDDLSLSLRLAVIAGSRRAALRSAQEASQAGASQGTRRDHAYPHRHARRHGDVERHRDRHHHDHGGDFARIRQDGHRVFGAGGRGAVAGALAQFIFALGIVGTGLLAVPVLAGSTAYAVGEGRRWPVGLARKPKEAVAFYSVLALSVGLGVLANLIGIDPIKALYWSAVINGVLAAPVMAVMMLLVRRRSVMGDLVVRGPVYWLGWIATAAMALCIIGMALSMFIDPN